MKPKVLLGLALVLCGGLSPGTGALRRCSFGERREEKHHDFTVKPFTENDAFWPIPKILNFYQCQFFELTISSARETSF